MGGACTQAKSRGLCSADPGPLTGDDQAEGRLKVSSVGKLICGYLNSSKPGF
jgi:hypothetical protein